MPRTSHRYPGGHSDIVPHRLPDADRIQNGQSLTGRSPPVMAPPPRLPDVRRVSVRQPHGHPSYTVLSSPQFVPASISTANGTRVSNGTWCISSAVILTASLTHPVSTW